MEKKIVKNTLFIITYTVLLALFLIKFDSILDVWLLLIGALKPFFIGFGIAFVLARPCDFFEKTFARWLGRSGKKYSRGFAVLASYMMFMGIISALFSFVLPQVGNSIGIFINGLSGYIANLQMWFNELVQYLDWEVLENVQVDFAALNDYIKTVFDGVMVTITSAAGQVVEITGSLFSTIITGVLSVVFSVYMLVGGATLLRHCRKVLRAYVKDPWATRVQNVVNISAHTFTNFVTGQITEAAILGGLCAIGMLFIYADYAPLIGIVVGVFALVPVAGAYLGAMVSALLLVMVTPMGALAFLVFLTILQQFEGNVIYPRVVGSSIGLPGIWVLTAVTVGGGLFGLLGVLLSVPIVSVLYTLLRLDVNRRLDEQDNEVVQVKEKTQ